MATFISNNLRQQDKCQQAEYLSSQWQRTSQVGHPFQNIFMYALGLQQSIIKNILSLLC